MIRFGRRLSNVSREIVDLIISNYTQSIEIKVVMISFSMIIA